MSGSQEAASALAQLQRQRDEQQRKVDQWRTGIRENEKVVADGAALLKTLRAQEGAALRELGRIEGTTDAMRSPLGYGGAPAISSYERLRDAKSSSAWRNSRGSYR